MAYKLMKDNTLDSNIYVIPLSSNNKDYKIIYPENLEKTLSKYNTKITIKQFEQCPETASNEIKKNLKRILGEKYHKNKGKTITYLFGGGALLLLGGLNLILPDPLILLDEIAMVIGGGILVRYGYKIKKEYPKYEENIREMVDNISNIETEENNLLSKIYNAIASKEKNNNTILEVEYKWLINLDISELINHIKDEAETKEIMDGLSDIIPFVKILKLEKKKNIKKKKKLINKVKEKIRLSNNALEVYCEFYKSIKDYFEKKEEGNM